MMTTGDEDGSGGTAEATVAAWEGVAGGNGGVAAKGTANLPKE
jgi:hypothetical protein